MINFYNYFNFFYFNKKNFFNFILNIWKSSNKYYFKNFLVFSVFINCTKIDIKNSVEFFLEIKVLQVNTLILKKKIKKKKAFIRFDEFI